LNRGQAATRSGLGLDDQTIGFGASTLDDEIPKQERQ
jgi:hypothetical protein